LVEYCYLEFLLLTITRLFFNYCVIDERREDRQVWVGEDTQEYFVRSVYSILNGKYSMQSSKSFKLLWSLSAAPSAIVGAWRILLDRLSTRLNLARRGVPLANPLCPLCQDDVESNDHLFNTCIVVQQVWDLCDRWIGKVGVRYQATLVNFQSFCLLGEK